jgi:hypothetical protein
VVHISWAVWVLLVQVPPAEVVAVTVTATGPAPVQVKLGDAELVLLNEPVPVPPVTAQEKIRPEVFPLPSIAVAARAIELPTSTVDGLAETEVTAAQDGAIVAVPLTRIDPVVPASGDPPVHSSVTATGLVEFATTAKPAEPTQLRALVPSVVAVRAIV